MRSWWKPAGLTLLVLTLIIAGCISIGPPPPSGTGKRSTPTPTATPVGDFPHATTGHTPRVSLSATLTALVVADREGSLDTRGMTLRQVYGYGVDSSGLARTWVLGMEKDGKTILLAYSGGEWKELGLETVLPEGEVKPGEVIPPEELFRENLDAIVSAMNSRRVGECDLTLNETTYLVTIRSATGSSTLTFSANTGKVRVTGTQTPSPASPAAPPGRLALPPLLPSLAAALAIAGLRRRY